MTVIRLLKRQGMRTANPKALVTIDASAVIRSGPVLATADAGSVGFQVFGRASDNGGSIYFSNNAGSVNYHYLSATPTLLTISDITSTGYVQFSAGSLVLGGAVKVPDGTAGVPGLAFVGDPDTGVHSGGADTIGMSTGGVLAVALSGGAASATTMTLASRNVGGSTGARINLQGNHTAGGAPGSLVLSDRTGAIYAVFADASAQLRISGGSVPTTTSGDGIGVVVGTQTSRREEKTDLAAFTDDASALALIQQTPLWHFRYRSGAFGGSRFLGILADEAPAFVMDPDETGLGRVFNPISAFGYSAAAIKVPASRVAALEARVVELERR